VLLCYVVRDRNCVIISGLCKECGDIDDRVPSAPNTPRYLYVGPCPLCGGRSQLDLQGLIFKIIEPHAGLA
jgi:hypothetical protein